MHLINRLSTPFLHNKSPFQIVYNFLPDITFRKVFGSLCFASTLQASRKKLNSRSRKWLYLGFITGVNEHTFDLNSKEIFLARDVIFFESIFPYKSSENASPLNKSQTYNPFLLDGLFDFTSMHESNSNIPNISGIARPHSATRGITIPNPPSHISSPQNPNST